MRVVVLQKLQQAHTVALARHAQVIDDRSLRGWAQAVEPCRQFGDQSVRVSRKRQCRLGHKLRVMEVVTPLDQLHRIGEGAGVRHARQGLKRVLPHVERSFAHETQKRLGHRVASRPQAIPALEDVGEIRLLEVGLLGEVVGEAMEHGRDAPQVPVALLGVQLLQALHRQIERLHARKLAQLALQDALVRFGREVGIALDLLAQVGREALGFGHETLLARLFVRQEHEVEEDHGHADEQVECHQPFYPHGSLAPCA